MHNYMRQELEKLRNATYDNLYSQEIIKNLHYESQSIAYYADDWKFLYYLKMFPNQKLHEIPVNLQRESLEKYANIIEQCKSKNMDQKDENDIQEEDNNNDVEMNGNPNVNDEDMTNIERKRKTMNDTIKSDKPSLSSSNSNDQPKSRKKRKITERILAKDSPYNTAQLCVDQDYLTYDQKIALYKAFEFTTLIESVWNLSRKSFITAYINMELDLPSMSGLQSCIELGWSVFPTFKELPDDISTDFDDILALYKDFNKEKQVRSRAPFASALLAHHNAANSDDDTPIQNGLGLAAMKAAAAFKWEDYDTLDDESSSDEDDNAVVVDAIPDNDRRIKNRELPHVPTAVRRHTAGSFQGTPLMAWDAVVAQMGQNKDSDDEKKQQKGRFRVHSDDGDGKDDKKGIKSIQSKLKKLSRKLYYKEDMTGDRKENMDQDQDEEEQQESGVEEYAYGEYDEVGDDMRAKEEIRDGEDYIGYTNRKEFKLDMKKRRIIRRSKTKEYKDRIDKYGTSEFLYTQIQPYVDQPNKKKRSKHKYVRLI